MSIRITALIHLAFPFVGLLAVAGSCNSTGGELDLGTGGSGDGGANSGGHGGAGGRGTGGSGGSHSGGASGGQGGDSGGQSGSGGLGRGGSCGASDGVGTKTAGAGGNVGKDAAAGSSQGGSPGKEDVGSGGAQAASDAGPVACDDIQSPGRLAVYFYDNSKATDSAIQLHFDVVNYTAYTSRLQQVTVKYWFTDEDPTSANVVEQYYVPITTTMKFSTVNPPRTGANTVLEMSFRDAPDAGASWVETRGFNLAFHKTSYAGTNDQSNDYSYDPKLTTALGPNPKITAYVNGALAWGCEPPLQPVVMDAGVAPAVEDADVVDAPASVPDSRQGAPDARQGG